MLQIQNFDKIPIPTPMPCISRGLIHLNVLQYIENIEKHQNTDYKFPEQYYIRHT